MSRMPSDSNPTLALLHRHRSIRQYTEERVDPEDLGRAVTAAQMASTSSAVQAYCAIHVTDEGTRRALVPLTGQQTKVAEAGAFLVICGDNRRHRLIARRAERPHAENLESFLVATIDAALFAQNLAIAFESLGYGICYIGALRNESAAVDQLLAIPEGVFPLFGMCVGRPKEAPIERPRLPIDAVLFDDRYPSDERMLDAIDRYDSRYETYLKERGARPSTWSKAMCDKYAKAERPHLAAYYASKGARLT